MGLRRRWTRRRECRVPWMDGWIAMCSAWMIFTTTAMTFGIRCVCFFVYHSVSRELGCTYGMFRVMRSSREMPRTRGSDFVEWRSRLRDNYLGRVMWRGTQLGRGLDITRHGHQLLISFGRFDMRVAASGRPPALCQLPRETPTSQGSGRPEHEGNCNRSVLQCHIGGAACHTETDAGWIGTTGGCFGTDA